MLCRRLSSLVSLGRAPGGGPRGAEETWRRVWCWIAPFPPQLQAPSGDAPQALPSLSVPSLSLSSQLGIKLR